MIYKYIYKTPKEFSNMIMNSDGDNLTGLWFEGSRDVSKHIIDCEEKKLPIFDEIIKWLDVYFSGKKPTFIPFMNFRTMTTSLLPFIASRFCKITTMPRKKPTVMQGYNNRIIVFT